jgi:hypothetical protein
MLLPNGARVAQGLLEALPRPARDARRRSDRAGLVGARAAQGPFATLLAERHARHLAGRAQTLQDARKPMHTDPSTI